MYVAHVGINANLMCNARTRQKRLQNLFTALMGLPTIEQPPSFLQAPSKSWLKWPRHKGLCQAPCCVLLIIDLYYSLIRIWKSWIDSMMIDMMLLSHI